jgi:protein-S-isoprenylcysteine O-methyltransferase Ste14
MYVGFGLFTMTSIIYTWNIFILIAGVYSLIVYHFIIKNEEKFLINRFGTAYENYKKSVTRYL